MRKYQKNPSGETFYQLTGQMFQSVKIMSNQFGRDYRCKNKCNMGTGLDSGPEKNVSGTTGKV